MYVFSFTNRTTADDFCKMRVLQSFACGACICKTPAPLLVLRQAKFLQIFEKSPSAQNLRRCDGGDFP